MLQRGGELAQIILKFATTWVSKILAFRIIIKESVEQMYSYKYCSPNMLSLVKVIRIVFSSYVDSLAFLPSSRSFQHCLL